MHEPFDPFDFPDLSDEAVIAIDDFIEEFYRRFQNHYFAQMHRYDYQRPREQMPLPFRDPPF
jgi:hypothetical protein